MKPPNGIWQLLKQGWHMQCWKHCLFLRRAAFKTRRINAALTEAYFPKLTELVQCNSNKASFFICSHVHIRGPLLRPRLHQARQQPVLRQQRSAVGGELQAPLLSLILTLKERRNSSSPAEPWKQDQHWPTLLRNIKISYQEDMIWPHSM